jgi:hypothetical protein
MTAFSKTLAPQVRLVFSVLDFLIPHSISFSSSVKNPFPLPNSRYIKHPSNLEDNPEKNHLLREKWI